MSALPFDLASLRPGENRIPCPHCERGPRDTALSVRLAPDGHAIWKCHRCGWTGSSGRGTQQPAPTLPRKTARPMRALSDHGRRLWDAARPLTGPAQAYLESRACRIPPDHGHLRWLPDLRHPSGYAGPALLGLITDAITGRAISLHRTWIRTDGRKAAVEPPRLLLKGCAKAGGVIRLWPECQGQPLAIAEGIETALSLAWAVVPAWACIDAGNLGALPVLRGVSELVIAADNDPTGEQAASDCATRWAQTGRTVRIVRASDGHNDINDEARAWAE